MGVTVHIDTSGMPGWRKRMDAAAMQAARMAGSSAIRAMRAEGSRRVREHKAINRTDLNRAITIHYPTDKSTLLWRVKASGDSIPLAAFKHTQTRHGVSVTVRPGKKTIVRGAFIATMRSGHSGIFKRRGAAATTRRTSRKGQRAYWVGSLPIREAYATTVAGDFERAMPAVTARGREVFASTFERIMALGAGGRA